MLAAMVINGKKFLMVICCGEHVWYVNGGSLKCERSWGANGYAMGRIGNFGVALTVFTTFILTF